MKNRKEVLNEALNLQIEIEAAETPVGSFRLDLAGTETTTQKPVVIENQFGDLNHDHLGKLITYFAGREAGILIWVASDFREPHRNALSWLNNISGQNMLFYGVKLEVFQIHESKPAAKFTVIAEPPTGKRPTIGTALASPRGLKYREFWAGFVNRLKTEYPGVTKASAPQPYSYFNSGAGVSGFSVGAGFNGDRGFQVELYIDTGSKDQNEQAFEKLRESEGAIHEALGEPLDWQKLPERRACRIRLVKEGTIDESPQDLQEYLRWGTEYMAKFKEVFRDRIIGLTVL